MFLFVLKVGTGSAKTAVWGEREKLGFLPTIYLFDAMPNLGFPYFNESLQQNCIYT